MFAWSASLENHMKVHSGEKRFKCGICGRMFLHLGSLRSHMTNRHTVNGKFTCVVCKETFKEATELILHMKSHNEQESVKCERCYAFFTSLNDLETHMCTNFGGKPLVCVICHNEFADTNTYCNHNCMAVSAARKCGCCGKHLKSIWHLREHLITHTGEKPFPCPECNKRFRRQRELNIHMTRHSSDLLFKCPHCESRFTSDNYMKQHMRKKHREKKFFCDVCNHAFMHKCALTNHMVYHTKTGNTKFGKRYHRGKEMLIPELVAQRLQLEQQGKTLKDLGMPNGKQFKKDFDTDNIEQDVRNVLECVVTKVEQVCLEDCAALLMTILPNQKIEGKVTPQSKDLFALRDIKVKKSYATEPSIGANEFTTMIESSSEMMIHSINAGGDYPLGKARVLPSNDMKSVEEICSMSSSDNPSGKGLCEAKADDVDMSLLSEGGDLHVFEVDQNYDQLNEHKQPNKKDKDAKTGITLSQVIEPRVSLRNAEQDPANITTIYQTDINGLLTVRCATCFRDFLNHGELLRHRKEVHDDGKPYQCDICTRTFTIAANLSTHRNIHNIKQKFSCSHCGRSYKVVHALREHLITKHNENTDHLTDLELATILERGKEAATTFLEYGGVESSATDLSYTTDTAGLSVEAQHVTLPTSCNMTSEESKKLLANIILMNPDGTTSSDIGSQDFSKREDLSFLVNLGGLITHLGGTPNGQKIIIDQQYTNK